MVRNTENAYVIEESKFNFLFGNDKDIWHIVERFGYHHLSYKLRHYWHLENRMNTLVQRCVEHGIDKYLKEKNKRLLTGIKSGQEIKDKEVTSSNVKLSDTTNSLLLGALGLLLSAVTFIAEKICFAICNRRRRLNKIREAPSFEIISEQTNSASYMMHVKDRDLTYLYPHDMDNFIIIVPKRFKSETKYDQIFKSPLILVWAPVAAIVSIVRFIFNKIWRTDKNIADISFETFGLSLGLSFGATISSAAENFLLWCFCLGTMLSGMLLSSEMFRGFAMQHDILTINNLKDLETSGLIVYMPFFIEPVESFFTNTPYTLKLIPESSYDIAVMIETRNTENAYVIEESKFNFLFGNDKDIWHVVERFGYHHLSYKLLRLWHLENRMNTLVQRCVEHGIDKYLKEKNKRLLSGIKHREETKDKELLSTNVKSLSLSDMTNSFLLGALGLLLSAVTFAAEKICFAIRNRKRRLNK
ncbi:hypothetical protein Bhyg_06286 [Pseudolycoriella hygida]|uniref:Ionotropic receptor n=1 Tax=Pseudolycoriella hygida TaxID=35572 RepID=A0A9Q0N2C4_9DIPT|nr:hypothetical protein Bhyg_06286 [Pseudolycoriella hygida]